MPILEWGNAEQKKRYLTAAASGKKIMAFGLTEPEAGSNPLELQMTYRREGDHFLLNGVKYLISNGGIAGAIVTFAYPEGRNDRISAFIVDTRGPGFECGPYREARASPLNTAMFELTNYAVPSANLLGEEGNGFRIAMNTLISGRLSVAAGCVGVIEMPDRSDQLCQGAAPARQTDRQTPARAGSHRVVEMGRQAAESLWKRGRRQGRGPHGSQELDAPRAGRHARRPRQILRQQCRLPGRRPGRAGPRRRGYSELYRPGRHWKDVRVCRIYEGTNEILKLKIASALLGKEYAAFR